MSLSAVNRMPCSVELVPDGDAEVAGELVTGFVTVLIVGVLCLLSVLVLLFKEFFRPITILSALPLSLVGALAAVLLMRTELDVPAMIGLVMFTGIVAKNSILLVEYPVVGIRDRKFPLHDASASRWPSPSLVVVPVVFMDVDRCRRLLARRLRRRKQVVI